MITYNLKISGQDPRVLYSDMEFVAGDVGAYRLNFTFLDNGANMALDGYALAVKVKRADGVVLSDAGEIIEDTAVYVPKNDCFATPGAIVFEIALTNSAKKYITTKIITATVLPGVGVPQDAAEDNVSVYVTLIAQIQAKLDTANALLQDALTAAETAESASQTAEGSKDIAISASASAEASEQVAVASAESAEASASLAASFTPNLATECPETLACNTIYDLGTQTALTLNLPSGNLTDFIQVDFLSGATPTTLTITSASGLSVCDFVPESNMIYSLYFDWGVLYHDGTQYVYGWRFAYGEYVASEV